MNMKHTPGPWVWMSDGAGPEDEYGCSTAGPIDPHTFKSSGYWNNPQLYGPDESCVLTAGGGEYTPYQNPADALLIAEAPAMLAALRQLAFNAAWAADIIQAPAASQFREDIATARELIARIDGAAR